MQKMDKVRFYPTCKPYIALLGQRTANCALLKLIGVQSNHGVEYFGGPAAPTLRFPHNQHSILMAATSLGRYQQVKPACSLHIVINRFAFKVVS